MTYIAQVHQYGWPAILLSDPYEKLDFLLFFGDCTNLVPGFNLDAVRLSIRF